MTGVGVLGLLWAAVGILLGILWWRERAAGRHAVTQAGERATQGVRFGSLREDRSPRRLQAMRLSYALGAWLVALGLVSDLVGPLALGALALNLGTLFRYLVVALDQEGLDTRLAERERPGHLVFGEQALV